MKTAYIREAYILTSDIKYKLEINNKFEIWIVSDKEFN